MYFSLKQTRRATRPFFLKFDALLKMEYMYRWTCHVDSPSLRTAPNGSIHCDLCLCYVGSTKEDAIRHENGRKHNMQLRKDDMGSNDLVSAVRCELCKKNLLSDRFVSCHLVATLSTGAKLMVEHGKGRKHMKLWRRQQYNRKKEVVLRDGASDIASEIIALCGICGITDQELVHEKILAFVGLEKVDSMDIS